MPRTGLTLETFGGRGIPVNEPVVYIAMVSSSTDGRRNRRLTNGQTDNSSSYEASTKNSTSLSNRLISLKVTADAKRSSEAEITLWNEDQALQDTPIMQKGTLIKLAWGYSGYMGKVRTFKVHKVKGTTARVRNFGQLRIIALSQIFDFHGSQKSKCFRNATVVGVARQIGKKYGLGDSDLVLGPDDGKRGTFHQVNQTDAQFLASLAQKLGWTFQVEDGTLTFAPPDIIDKNRPIASYTYFNDEEGWIKRFEPETTVMSLPGSVTVKSRDPVTGKRVQHTQTIQNKKKKSLCRFVELVPEKKAGSQVFDENLVTGSGGVTGSIVTSRGIIKDFSSSFSAQVVPSSQTVNSPSKNASQVKQEAQTRHQNALLNSVKSRMVIVGDPDIWHSVLINVYNVGKMLSGLHRVYKCIINIGSHGFDIDCKLRREGVGTLGKNKRVRNDQKASSQRVTRRLRSRVSEQKRTTSLNTLGTVKRTRFKRR